MAKTVIRITRHQLTADRLEYLQSRFSEDVEVVTEDIRYGADPVDAVKALIDRHENVVAVEAQAPFPVLMKLVDARRELGVKLIRAQFERGEDGRAVVIGKDESGRDLLKFSHYEELVRIIFETDRL